MAMKHRRYEELNPWFRDPGANSSQVHSSEGKLAIEKAHAEALDRVQRLLGEGQSVIVACDKALARHVEELTRTRTGLNWLSAPPVPLDDEHSGYSASSFLVDQLGHRLSDAANSTRDPVVSISYLDLMCWTVDGRPRHELNDVVYWLSEFSGVSKIAFWDPCYALPKAIERLFRETVSLETHSRDTLWELISPEEARKIGPREGFTIPAQLALYQYLSGANVAEVRRILRGLTEPEAGFPDYPEPEQRKKVFAYIRQQTSTGTVQPTAEWERGMAGYAGLRDELNRRVVFPMELRIEADTEFELKQADALVPSGVILFGPPGNGKTEWAKWLACRLGATLFVIHGPELRRPLVGDTEAEIRHIFHLARRAAPSIIVIDELDAITPSRTVGASNFEASMVAQLLTEMQGLRGQEAVLVIGTTNRLDAIDAAFRRPGRFGVRIEVGYPARNDAEGIDDRKEILAHYNQELSIGLNEASLQRLSDIIQEVASSASGTDGDDNRDGDGLAVSEPVQFSGDHLRAVCLHVLREKVLAEKGKTDGAFDVNDSENLEAAVREVGEAASRQSINQAQVQPASTGPSSGRFGI